MRKILAISALVLAQLSRAGVVTIDLSGSSPGETYSGQLQYDTATPVCLSCNITLAGPVQFTDSRFGGLTVTSVSSNPLGRFFVSNDGGQEVVSIFLGPLLDLDGFNFTGPNAGEFHFSGPSSGIQFDFRLPQPFPASLPFPSPFPDLTQAQSVTFEMSAFAGILREDFGGITNNLSTTVSAVPEPHSAGLVVFAIVGFAMLLLRKTSSIL